MDFATLEPKCLFLLFPHIFDQKTLTMKSHFIFKKLPLDPHKAEIRLLQLDYDDSNGPVRCGLAVADLADNPIYEAVSYAWGDLVEESTIILNGVACRVSKHLEAFLRSVRSRTSQTLIDDLG